MFSVLFGYSFTFINSSDSTVVSAQTTGEVETSVEVPFSDDMKTYVRNNSIILADPISVNVGEGSRITVTVINYTGEPLEGSNVKLYSENPDAVLFQPGSPTDQYGMTYGFVTSEVDSEVFVTATAEVHEEIISIEDTAKVEFLLTEEEEISEEDDTIEDREDEIVDDTDDEQDKEESIIDRLPITSREEFEEYVSDFVDSTASSIRNYSSDNPFSTGLAASLPMVTTTSTVLITSGATFFEIPNLLFRIFVWVSNLLGLRKKYKPWGRVYDSITKLPISMAVVRIYDENSSLIGTAVTDINGVFSFKIKNGKYSLNVRKKNYNFPSDVITTSVDGLKKNVYNGGDIEIKENEVHNLSVPVDPVEVSNRDKFFNRLKSRLSWIVTRLNPMLAVLGGLLSLILYFDSSNIVNIVFTILYFILLILHFVTRFLFRRRIGIVYSSSGRRISGVKIGLYDPTYDKLVDYVITESNGEYRFVVPGSYYLLRPVGDDFVIDEKGYEEGYLVGKKTDGVISINRRIKLRKV